MVPNHVELEFVARHTHETRVREADSARQLAVAAIAQRPPSLLTLVGGKRVRWWFWSRITSQEATAALRSPACTDQPPAVDAPEPVPASLPAERYEVLVVIARGRRQRHERLVSQRS